ncbi:bifunctional coenzyme A synthase [Centruroides vittatus]|uniref:bifunctional coenzyme A synthase n=1 Tax=Centruroides vittatus TaxID=120091 RepID=UPI00350F8527
MFQTGVLILTSPAHHIINKVSTYLASAKQLISNRLYIKIEPNFNQFRNQTKIPTSPASEYQLLLNLIPTIYAQASKACSHLDVRVLQTFAKTTNPIENVSTKLDIILIDNLVKTEDVSSYFKQSFSTECSIIRHLNVNDSNSTSVDEYSKFFNDEGPIEMYGNTVLGGTFDHLHNGHKIFLSAAVLRTKRQLVVGVTDGAMLKKKILWELIKPIDQRISALKEFLTDIDPTISYNIVPIYDPFGPSIEVPGYDCIIVTEETLKGGYRVNEERKKRNMPELKIYKIPVLSDPERNAFEELKISSSSLRMRSLGTLIQYPKPKPHLLNSPYIIGVTGGIASGKSAIVKHLQQLGAAVVDCDRLSHKSYEPKSKLYNQIVEEFGKDIVNLDGFINRKALGVKVFGNENLRRKLNNLVWPEVIRMADEEIKQHAKKGVSIIVMEVALLLEAGWEDKVHQVWVCIIPEKEAIKRIRERDGLSEEQALQRINSQMSNKERVDRANVIFCSFWEPEYTVSQVNKAWDQLQKFLTS